jgi:Cdc25 family phosphatase
MLPSFIESSELKTIIDEKPKDSYKIIDVRDEDFVGGNIIGAINIPSKQWNTPDKLAEIREQFKNESVLYFHCQLSQVRGPKCAQKYVNDVNQSGEYVHQEVFIIRGGFEEFQNLVENDKKYIENISYGY